MLENRLCYNQQGIDDSQIIVHFAPSENSLQQELQFCRLFEKPGLDNPVYQVARMSLQVGVDSLKKLPIPDDRFRYRRLYLLL